MAFSTDRCEMEKFNNYMFPVFNVVSDFYVVTIPIPVVIRFHMSKGKKIRVCSVFTLGLA
jgi:hypothetical protein